MKANRLQRFQTRTNQFVNKYSKEPMNIPVKILCINSKIKLKTNKPYRS